MVSWELEARLLPPARKACAGTRARLKGRRDASYAWEATGHTGWMRVSRPTRVQRRLSTRFVA